MPYAELIALAEAYPPAEKKQLLELARKQKRVHLQEMRDEQEVLDLAGIAADLELSAFVDGKLNPEFDPLVREAFRLVVPNKDPQGMSSKQLRHVAGIVKGKFFELLVVDRLNKGKSVGRLKLAQGQMARVAKSLTQPGWDIEIIGKNGRVLKQKYQLKATASVAYVKRALERYPNIKVLVPEPMREFGNKVTGAGMAHSELARPVQKYVDFLGKNVAVRRIEKVVGLGMKVVPVTSILVVTGKEGARVLVGRATLQEAMSQSGARLGRQAAYAAFGSTIRWTARRLAAKTAVAARLVNPAVAAATMAVSVAETRVRGRIALRDGLEVRTAELNLLFGEEAA